MRSLFAILLTIILFGWNKPVLAETNNYIVQCMIFGYKSPGSAYRTVTFRVDTSDLPDKQICGKSVEECSDAGFTGFIKQDGTSEGYTNYPTLVAKECLKLDFSGNFIKIEIGIIPHLQRAIFSIGEPGEDSPQVKANAAINKRDGVIDLYLEYKKGEKTYLVDCKTVYERLTSVVGDGELGLLSHSQPINTCK